MNARSFPNVPGLRDVVCMFCGWTWITGSRQDAAAKCPRCNHASGVQAFAVIRGSGEPSLIVKPTNWQI
jgi:hypothetical protein